MKKLSTIPFLIIGFLLLIISACGNKKDADQQAPPPPVPVSIYKVKPSSATYHDEYPATVVALNQVELRPQVNGYVTGIFFKEGDRVRKGQKLYSIDQQQYEANYQAAIAERSVQETNLAKAQKDAERYRELDKHDAIAKQQVDYAEAALEAAKKQVAAAQANVRGVQTGVRYATIYAPFSGTIGISQVKIGTAVSIGQPLLNTISSDDPVTVEFAIDQSEIPRFAKLEKNKSAKGDSIFTISFSDQSIYPEPGKIDFIDRAVNAQTGSIKLRLLFSNKDHLLRPGMSCNVRVLTNASDQLIIPFKSVTEQLGEYFVFIADSNKVTQRKIKLGTRIGLNVIVTEGLKVGEQIVTDGVQKLKEGSSITIVPQGKTEEKKR